MNAFSVIGAGRLGTSLGSALSKKGWTLKCVADRSLNAAEDSRRIIGGGRATADNARAAAAARILFVCVPDDSVEAVARELAKTELDWRGRTVFHTSGILPSSVLAPLKEKGARTASLHPAQSFPDKKGPARLFKGIFWGFEGDSGALRTARAVVRKLGGHVLLLAEKNKAVYHAACSLASNALAVLGTAAVDLLRETGIGREEAAEALFPLMQGSLQNVKNLGLEAALTGPIARGDLGTVRQHVEVLREIPYLAGIYRVLALGALERIPRGTLPVRRIRALKRLLEGE